MFTTELVHRVILTVLLLGALGNCANQQERTQDDDENNQDLFPPHHPHHHHEKHVQVEEDHVKRRPESQNLSSDKDDPLSFSSSSSPLSRSIPSFETRNYHDYYRNRYYRNRDSSPSSSSASSSSPYHPFESERPSSQAVSTSTSSSSSTHTPEMSTVISSTSYSVKPGSSGSGSNVYINTKATPIIISRHPTTTNPDITNGSNNGGSPFSSYFTNPRRGSSSSSSSSSGNSWDGDHYSSPPSTTDCFNGRNCPKGEDDEFKSYYSVLNGHLRYPDRLGGSSSGSGSGGSSSSGSSLRDRGRYEDSQREPEIAASSSSGNLYYDRHTIFPFHVHGLGPADHKHRFYPNPEDNYPKRRVTRTSTTSSPSWVKLQPIPSHKFYDPFLAKDNEASASSSSSSKHDRYSHINNNGNEKYDNVQFANRIGIELSPESFAERWGYGNGGSHIKNNGGGGGSRLPSWLEELNHHHKFHHQHSLTERRPYSGPTRDEDPKNWVKLDPIPVAGVSISKWVPKGTAASDLPSTGNLIRDKPTAWWDRTSHLKPPSMGWGSSAFSNRYPSPHETKRPSIGNSDPWKDIIYPDTPASATASWEASAGSTLLKGSSSFPSSTSSGGGGWKSETRRPSVASWTAPLTSSSSATNRFAILRPGSSNGGHHIPNNYPDPQAHDDPRWVLVSNSRRVALASGHQPSFSDRHKYRPPIGYRDDLDSSYEPELERERDRLPYYKPHRLAKDYKYSSSKDFSKNPAQIQQDEAFHKVNATLHNLTPVLNHQQQNTNSYDSNSGGGQMSSPEKRISTTTTAPSSTTTTTTTSRPPVQKPSKYSFLSALIGDGRGSSFLPTPASKNDANVNGTKITVVNRKGNSMKPILAAVGAGMIPATLAAVLPMMGKRRKRHVIHDNFYQDNPSPVLLADNLQTPIVFRNHLYLIPSSLESTPEKSRLNSQRRSVKDMQRHASFQNRNIIIPR